MLASQCLRRQWGRKNNKAYALGMQAVEVPCTLAFKFIRHLVTAAAVWTDGLCDESNEFQSLDCSVQEYSISLFFVKEKPIQRFGKNWAYLVAKQRNTYA